MRLPLAALTLAAMTACSQPDDARHAGALKEDLSTVPSWVGADALGRRLWALEREFYQSRDHAPAWIARGRPTRELDALLGALQEADLHGLDPEAYGASALAAARQRAEEGWFGAAFEPDAIPEIDLRLTYAFLTHAADLLGWRLSPRAIDPNWLPTPRKADLLAHLRAALDDTGVRKTLDALAPAHPQYRGLQAALARARSGEDTDIDVERIRLNLERWRWMPVDLGERHLLINIPAYAMQVVERGEPVLSMRVVVGAVDTPTPLFSDQMTYVVFSPYWNIPESILKEETLPRLAEDPEYLARNNIEVVGTSGEVVDASGVDWADEDATKQLRFRQAPGPENALGLVKFIFPNHFNVYLHDTPADALFNKPKRTFSHGCVRVERPVDLAEYVLQDKRQWTPDRIRAAMHAGREQTVTLAEPLPVHLGYWTAWVAADGSVTYFDDPYGLDRKQAKASFPQRAD